MARKQDIAVEMAREFPDYPVADLPQLPGGFAWRVWHNDACPLAYHRAGTLMLAADYRDTAKRELTEGFRFTLHRMGRDGTHLDELASSDAWQDILDNLIAESFVRILRRWLSKRELSEVRRENARHRAAGRDDCHSHNLCDPNEAMTRAFEDVMKREAFLSSDVGEPGFRHCELDSDDDFEAMARAWSIADARYLTSDTAAAPPMVDRQGDELKPGDLVRVQQPVQADGSQIWLYGRVIGRDGDCIIYAALNPEQPGELLWSDAPDIRLA